MNKKLIKLSHIVHVLDNFFEINRLTKDPAMSRFLPMVYEQIHVNWKNVFEKNFQKRFNGLMMKGADDVGAVFTASFPHEKILKTFLSRSKPGDLLFLHHPIILECGNPKGHLGKGFLPIRFELLEQIRIKRLSIYSCHAPLDYNKHISTNRAITDALHAKIKDEFLAYGNGYAGLIAIIKPISTKRLVATLKKIFTVPYVDIAGSYKEKITTIGVVAGGGDEIEYSQMAAEKGAQAYITGEIYSHYNNEWGKQNTAKIRKYAKTVNLSMIGVSHSASEFLVMKTQIPQWFNKNFHVPVFPLTQKTWWC